jgi:MFS family permease
MAGVCGAGFGVFVTGLVLASACAAACGCSVPSWQCGHGFASLDVDHAISYFAAGWGFVISATFTVAIVEREPALAGQGALAWAMVGLAAMPAVFIWDRVARRWGDKQALLLAFGLQTLSVVLPAVSGSLWAALAGALGYGATFIGIVSLTLALVGRRSPNNPGKAMARLTLSYGAAQMLAPVVAGYMAQATGTFKGALWLTAGVMLAGMALLATLPQED